MSSAGDMLGTIIGLTLVLAVLGFMTGTFQLDFADIWVSMIKPALYLLAVVIVFLVIGVIFSVYRSREEDLFGEQKPEKPKGERSDQKKEPKNVGRKREVDQRKQSRETEKPDKIKGEKTKSEKDDVKGKRDKEESEKEEEIELSHPRGIVGLGNITKKTGDDEDYVDEEESEEDEFDQ
ncbi:MAG: hypothetical protein ABH950_02005 [Candidatus Altiarchaeota archaeon]